MSRQELLDRGDLVDAAHECRKSSNRVHWSYTVDRGASTSTDFVTEAMLCLQICRRGHGVVMRLNIADRFAGCAAADSPLSRYLPSLPLAKPAHHKHLAAEVRPLWLCWALSLDAPDWKGRIRLRRPRPGPLGRSRGAERKCR